MSARPISSPSVLTLMFKTAFVNVFVMIANALGMIVCARILGAESRGILAAWMIWPPVLSAIFAFGMNSSFIYFAKHESGLYARYASALIVAAFVMSLVGAGLMWGVAPYVNHANNVPGLRTWLSVFAFGMIFFTLMSGISQTTQNLNLYNLTRVIPPALYLLLTVCLSFVVKLDTLYFLAIYIAGYLVSGAILGYSALRDLGQNFSFDFLQLKKLSLHGLKFWCLDFMSVMSAQIDKIFLVAYLSPRVVGIYAVAYGLSRILTQLQLAIATVIFPRTAGKSVEVVSEQVSMAFRLSFIGSFILALIGIAIGKYAIVIMYGNQYASAFPIFSILVIESIVSGGGWILSQTFNSIGRTELIVVRQIVSMIVTCVALYFLTNLWQGEGVALSLLAGSITRFIMTVSAYPVFLKIPRPKLLFCKQDFDYLISRFNKK